ncbi:MAG TPA: tetratricopeptide repeat protein [Bryobacteraceae bacterium]|jgi:tetratricopeptide (TPR) repeat protein|nr:tetratricopeptide repeat protein [Bryobacteraceae bacterium]
MKLRSSILLCAAVLAACSKSPQQKEAKFLDTGRRHLVTRDFQSAIIDFRNASQIMPTDGEPHYQLGVAQLGLGNPQIAANEFRRALQLDSKHVGAQLKLAELMSVNRNPDVVREGEKRAQAILEVEPGNPDALQALAIAELRLGEDPSEAIAHLEEALEKVPGHLDSAMTLAIEKLHANDVAGAEKVLLKSSAAAPKSPEHAVVLARFYILLDKPQEADRQFRRALDLDPANGPALVGLGNLLYRTGKRDEAGQLYERAARLPGAQYRPLHAMFLLETGKNDAALAEFDRIHKANRDDREARGHLIAAYIKLHRVSDAKNVLNEAIKQNPQDAEAKLQRGDLLLASGEYQQAEGDLTEALRFKTDWPAAHLALAKLHQARGENEQQIQELTEALRLAPGMITARVELAHVLTYKNSPRAAIQVLGQAPEKDRQNLRLTAERNNALYALGDYAGLRAGLDESLKISRDPVLLLQDGLLRLKLKDYKGSRASLNEALEKQPREWKAVEALALSYLAEKNIPEATRIVKERTARAPDSASGQELLGSWLARTGDATGARAAFQAERALPNGESAADLSLATLDYGEGKFDSARNTLTQLVKREPHNVQAILQMAQIEDKTGRPMEAIAYYEKAIQENSNNPPALNNLAYLLADTGKDPDRALALAQQAKELLPNSPTVDDTIGWAYYKKGFFNPALDHLKRANSNSPQRLCHLAMTYYQLGDHHQAYTILQSVMKSNASLPEAKEAMALLGNSQ